MGDERVYFSDTPEPVSWDDFKLYASARIGRDEILVCAERPQLFRIIDSEHAEPMRWTRARLLLRRLGGRKWAD